MLGVHKLILHTGNDIPVVLTDGRRQFLFHAAGAGDHLSFEKRLHGGVSLQIGSGWDIGTPRLVEQAALLLPLIGGVICRLLDRRRFFSPFIRRRTIQQGRRILDSQQRLPYGRRVVFRLVLRAGCLHSKIIAYGIGAAASSAALL